MRYAGSQACFMKNDDDYDSDNKELMPSMQEDNDLYIENIN